MSSIKTMYNNELLPKIVIQRLGIHPILKKNRTIKLELRKWGQYNDKFLFTIIKKILW